MRLLPNATRAARQPALADANASAFDDVASTAFCPDDSSSTSPSNARTCRRQERQDSCAVYSEVQTRGTPCETLICPKVTAFLNLLRVYGSRTTRLTPTACSSSVRTASDPPA